MPDCNLSNRDFYNDVHYVLIFLMSWATNIHSFLSGKIEREARQASARESRVARGKFMRCGEEKHDANFRGQAVKFQKLRATISGVNTR